MPVIMEPFPDELQILYVIVSLFVIAVQDDNLLPITALIHRYHHQLFPHTTDASFHEKSHSKHILFQTDSLFDQSKSCASLNPVTSLTCE